MTIPKVIGRETISDLSSSVGFTASQIHPAKPNVQFALIQAIDSAIRYIITSGDTPTSSLGLRVTKDSHKEIHGHEAMVNFRVIDDGGTAKLEVVYFGVPA